MLDDLTEEQKQIVTAAQEKFKDLKERTNPLDEEALNLVFGEARSMNGWQDKDVSDAMIRSLYDLTKMGPTSTNCSPARFVFVKSEAEKAKLESALLPNNISKVMTAPVVAIIGYDLDFSDHMTKLFPHMDVAPMYKGNDEMNVSDCF